MKTSNIILTAFCFLFLVYVFGIAAEIRFRGEKTEMFVNIDPIEQHSQDCTSDFRKDQPLPPFKVLKINRMSKEGLIKFNPDVTNTFSVYAKNEEQIPELEYHTAGDTLFIDKMNKEALCNEFSLELTAPPLKIIADSMTVRLSSTADHLKNLNIAGYNSHFDLFNIVGRKMSADSLQVDLKNNSSLVSFSSFSVKNLQGEISDNSKIEALNLKAESAKVEIGATSSFSIDAAQYFNQDSLVKITYEKLGPDSNL